MGILLERHPLRHAKALLMGGLGGSAGVPDSLVHKPVTHRGGLIVGGRRSAEMGPQFQYRVPCACFGRRPSDCRRNILAGVVDKR